MTRGVHIKRKLVSVLLSVILSVTCLAQVAFAQDIPNLQTTTDQIQTGTETPQASGVDDAYAEDAGQTSTSVDAGQTDVSDEQFTEDEIASDETGIDEEETGDAEQAEDEDDVNAQSGDKPTGAGGSEASGKVAIYRMFNPKTGEHLFTTEPKERYTLVASYGWKYEGIGWYGPSKGDAVYRVYNPNTRQHLYTKSAHEVSVLVKSYGWKKDFGGNPLFYSGGGVAVYRVYNQKKTVGSHHWTPNAAEYRYLGGIGYKQEGVAFYGTAGESRIVSSTTATVKAGSVTADASKDSQKTFVVHANKVSMSKNIQKIAFAVWSDENGKDDLVKYTASFVSTSSYKATVSISKHKSPGKYNVSAFTVTPAGKEVALGSTTFNVTRPTGQMTISNVNKDKGTFRCTAANLSSVSGISKVRYEVWCKADKSDVKWYDATKTDGTYTTAVSAAYHQYHSGTYKINQYLYAGNGLRVCTASGQQAVSLKCVITAAAQDKMRTTYKITVINPVSANGKATAVKCATWSTTGGQDDLIWYNAVQQSNGSFVATIYANNHLHGGEFTTHVYGMIGGRLTKIGTVTYYVKSYSLSGLVAFVKTKIGTPYVYGTAGEKLTLQRFYELQKLYGKSMVWDSDINKVGKVCTDCSGLISWYTGVRMTSQGFYDTAVKRVKISQLNESMVGWILWMPGHVGVYIGGGYYIGADGSKYNTQKKPVSWQNWSYALLPAGFQK